MNKTAARLAPDVSEIEKTSLHLEQVPGMKTPKNFRSKHRAYVQTRANHSH